jgi:small-conductance mechanosensitive channel
MGVKRTALLLAAVMAALIIAVPLFSENAEGASQTVNGVTIWSTSDSDTINLRAGESKTISVYLENKSGDIRHVDYIGSSFSKGTITISNNAIPVLEATDSESRYTVYVKITADPYSSSVGDVAAGMKLLVSYLDAATGVVEEEASVNWTVNITSGRASENQYNKILGVVNNPFPGPFDTAMYAAAATLLLWLGIAFFVSYVLLPKIVWILFRKYSKEDKKNVTGKIKKGLLFILILYGFTVSVAVTGASEYIIRTVEIIAYIVYIILGMQIAWRAFNAVMDMVLKYKQSDATEKGGDAPDNSMRPLFSMVFKIILGMVAAGLVLAVLGLDTMFIATGAGIVGLAISFGAQSTLAQFFSGFTLLLNRPLRPGDLVRIGTNNDTLRVVNIGFMMTTFRNWANAEVITMPNQMVVSSTIINITAESRTYRIVVIVKVSYTADVMLAKTLALEAMREHPRILQDGSEEIPKARFEEFSDSSLTIRVSGFVDDFEDHRSIAGEIRESIFRKYKENDITPAIPKMDIYIKNPDDEKEDKY